MAPLLFVLLVVLSIAYGVFHARLYTGFALPSLKEDVSLLPSRQMDQVRRYVESEERAGRKRWYFGLVRRALLIQLALIALLLATVYLAVSDL